MWRSILFIPVLEERFLAKAADRGADAIVLDLEASIAPARKAEARDALPAAIERLAAQGQDVLVRINMLWRAAFLDLEQAVQPGLSAVVVPGCESAAQMQAVDAVIGELEALRARPSGEVKIVPIIETARGVRDVDSILRASDRIAAVGFGIEDYLADMGAEPSADLLTSTSLALAQATRAADAVPLIVPESLANINDADTFEAAAERGRLMGSEGGFAVHPGQVERLNRVFTPDATALAHAQRVVDAAEQADAKGLGVITLDGRMIDLPIVIRARRLLARAAAGAAKQ